LRRVRLKRDPRGVCEARRCSGIEPRPRLYLGMLNLET